MKDHRVIIVGAGSAGREVAERLIGVNPGIDIGDMDQKEAGEFGMPTREEVLLGSPSFSEHLSCIQSLPETRAQRRARERMIKKLNGRK